jgi:hypothetical protein
MAKNITGNHDGLKGGNDTYTIQGRGSDILRKTLVEEVKKGKHQNHIITKINNVEYVKAKANSKTNDNVNRD